MAIEQIERKPIDDYELTFAATDDEGEPTPITDPGDVVITDAFGTVVHTSTPTPVAGTLVATVPVEDLPELGVYTAVCPGTAAGEDHEWTVRFELVGGHYFTIPELRAYDAAYADETKYPDDKLAAARTWAESVFEQPAACGVAFVPRSALETIRVPMRGADELKCAWPAIRRVSGVTVDGVALTSAELAALAVWDRTIGRNGGWDAGAKVVVAYEHGYDQPNEQVKKAALMLAKEYLVDSGLSSRATIESTDVGFYRLSIAGPGGRTGIPYVDAVIADNARRLPVY